MRRPGAALLSKSAIDTKAAPGRRTPKNLLCGGREIARARANRDILSRCLNLDLPVASVAFLVRWIVPKHVLRAELSGDLRESFRQRRKRIRAQKFPTGFLGQLLQITVCRQIRKIQHSRDRIVRRFITSSPRGGGTRQWSRGRPAARVNVRRQPWIIVRRPAISIPLIFATAAHNVFRQG